jgi:23S rRNA (guanine745-N1)-methyltransferase
MLDVGCGDGYFLNRACREEDSGEGLDISTAAVERASRRYSRFRFVVANADRGLPYADDSFDLATSITSRRPAAETRRVLRPGGLLLIAVPSPDDLKELRASIYGTAAERDRTHAILGDVGQHLSLVARERISSTASFSVEQLSDLLGSTYRGARFSEAAQRAALSPMEVTQSLDVMLFRPGL